MEDDYNIVDPSDIKQEPFTTCDVQHRKLTEALGSENMRVNQVTVEPGEVVTPHRHKRQEEIYVALTGGRVKIDNDLFDVPPGGVVRIGPEPLRNVLNNSGEQTHRWLMFGAPPLGTVDDFGETIVPDKHSEKF